MIQRRTRLIPILLLSVALLLAVPLTAAAKGGEFESVVKHIKTRYKAKRKGMPLLGLARFAVRIVRPAGVKSFQLAIFEDQDFSDATEDADLGRAVRGALDPSWQPIVRVISKPDKEQTHIYAKGSGKSIKLLVVNIEPREAVVVQVKVNPRTFAKWMKDPEIMGISLASKENKRVDRPKDAASESAETLRR